MIASGGATGSVLFRNDGTGTMTRVSSAAFQSSTCTNAVATDAYKSRRALAWAGTSCRLDPSTLIRRPWVRVKSLAAPSLLSHPEVYGSRPGSADWDGDGDLDLVEGIGRNEVMAPFFNYVPPLMQDEMWRNDETGQLTAATASAISSTTSNKRTYASSWGDIDLDGDVDLLTGGSVGSTSAFLHVFQVPMGATIRMDTTPD